MTETPSEDLYGLLAEFEHPEALLAAAAQARQAGYRRVEAYSPIPIDGLVEALGQVPTWLPQLTFLGGLLGGLLGYALQYYTTVFAYPLNVGGRPLHSWPAFLPIVFELTVLGAALFAVLGMLALNGLPRPHHPLFGVPRFKLASRDRFFLCIESRDGQFRLEETRQFLDSLNPHSIQPVPR
ncbi:MAG: DUF3341 domain-containing protein [Pirellulaceae bacterium]